MRVPFATCNQRTVQRWMGRRRRDGGSRAKYLDGVTVATAIPIGVCDFHHFSFDFLLNLFPLVFELLSHRNLLLLALTAHPPQPDASEALERSKTDGSKAGAQGVRGGTDRAKKWCLQTGFWSLFWWEALRCARGARPRPSHRLSSERTS
jgi:hypothetical protein